MTVRPHVLVTGGSRGIGAAVCRLAAARGWNATVNYASAREAADTVVADVEKAGGEAVAVQADIASESETTDLFDAAEKALGPVSSVIVNAGVFAPPSPLAEMDLERIRRIVAVNVTGALLTCREAARRMSRSRGGQGGTIVLLSSAAARLGAPGAQVDYAASKGAIESLLIGLSRELAPEGIRVNAVSPGLIDTEIHAAAGDPDRARRLGSTTPIGREGSAEEVAEAIWWLMSDASSYAAGANIDVTGGR